MKFSHGQIKQKGAEFCPTLVKNPETDFYPAYNWSWTAPLEKHEIMRQLDYMYENNIRIVYILPQPKDFRPKTSPTNLEPDYLTKEYFEIYRFAMEYAAKLGMQLWLYDEGGWPSGSANHKVVKNNPHLRNAHIEKREVPSPYKAGENAIAAFCDGVRISEGFESDSVITEYFTTHSPWEPELPNLCIKEATDCFIQLTHEGYRQYMSDMFAKQMKVAFTDEPAISPTCWFDGIEQRFYEKYGYDLVEYLPFLLDKQPASEKAMQARVDYQNLLGEAFCEGYFIPLRDWCRKNGLLSAGHLGGEDETRNCIKHGYISALRQLRALDIPGIDTIWRQIFPGKKNHFFPRFASSAANQIGSPYAVSESFSIYSHGFTFEQMRYVMNYQMVRGINLINIMSQSYKNDGVARVKGGPSFMPLMPHWESLGKYNKFAARMSYLMCIGKPEISCALYMPMNDFWAGGDNMEKAFDCFDNTGWALEKRHVPFDCIDDDFLETCTIQEGTLTTGNAHYSTIVIPECSRMPEASKALLERFKASGGRVISYKEIDTIVPVCDIDCEDVTVYKKSFRGGVLYLVVNEACEARTLSASFADKGNIYIANAEDGELYACNSTERITLESGESRVFIITEESHPSLDIPQKSAMTAILNRFEMRPSYRFMMGTTHFETLICDEPYRFTEPCDWCGILGKSFSGKAQYRMKFCLYDIPQSGVIIDMGDVRHTVKLTINGWDMGMKLSKPYTFFVPRSVLYHENEIIAEVANTPGNEFHESRIYETVPPNVIGPYRRIVAQFEGDTVESGLMSCVTIYECKFTK